MKKLVFLLVFLPLAQAQILGVGTHRKIYAATLPTTCTPVSGYAHCRILTIDHTQVGGSALTNFPVVTQNGSTALTLGSSRIQNANCYDVVFTSDSVGTTLVPWEVESCTQSTGAVIAWVLCPACSASVDTNIYVSYDKASISTAQNTGANGPTHVWDSNFGPVYHLGPSLSLADSTGGASATNSGATSGTGEIDGAASFTAGTSENITGHQWSAYSVFTVSYWVNWTSVSGYQFMVNSQNGPDASGFESSLYNASVLRTIINTSATGLALAVGSTTLSSGTWYHVVSVFDGSSIKVYLNGVLEASQNATGTFTFSAANKERIGAAPGIGTIADVNGRIDEYEFSTTARSLGWITSQYNNQKGGSTFLKVGAEI
jgi:hypothetical protein